MKKEIAVLFSSLLTATIIRYWDKKLIKKRNEQIDLLRIQKDILDHWLTMKERKISVNTYLQEINCEKIGIYGLSILGSHLYEELKNSRFVTKLVGIDQSDIYDNYDFQILKPEDSLDDIDLVIVTAVTSYSEIKERLETGFRGRIMSIQQLINECEKYYSYTV